jgi:hypothetical protein
LGESSLLLECVEVLGGCRVEHAVLGELASAVPPATLQARPGEQSSPIRSLANLRQGPEGRHRAGWRTRR